MQYLYYVKNGVGHFGIVNVECRMMFVYDILRSMDIFTDIMFERPTSVFT